MVKPWLRLYTEFVTDPKIQLLAFEDQRHFIALLCLKGNGTLDSEAPHAAFRDRMIAKALGLSVEAASEARRRLLEGGLIDENWHPLNWAARQFESDTSAQRTRRWRDRSTGDVTVTSQPRHSDVTVTPQSRSDTEQSRAEEERAQARATPSLNLPAWEALIEHRKRLRKPVKVESLKALAEELASHGDAQMAVVQQSKARGWEGIFAVRARDI